jgi:hypothetical protein
MTLETASDLADTVTVTEAGETPRRPPGRPKGYPRTGGRQKGTPNGITRDLRDLIVTRGAPIQLLCDVANGRRIRVGPLAGPGEAKFAYPTLQQRIQAAQYLTDKLLPTLKAAEITATADLTATTDATVRVQTSPLDAAVRIAGLLNLPLRIGGQDVPVPADMALPHGEGDAATGPVLDPLGNEPTQIEAARRIAYVKTLGERQLADALGIAEPPQPPEPRAPRPALDTAADAERRAVFALHCAGQAADAITEETPGLLDEVIAETATPSLAERCLAMGAQPVDPAAVARHLSELLGLSDEPEPSGGT